MFGRMYFCFYYILKEMYLRTPEHLRDSSSFDISYFRESNNRCDSMSHQIIFNNLIGFMTIAMWDF